MTKDYYAILGVTSAASQDEIRLAYEKMTSLPGGSFHSLEKKVEIEEAYFVLSNPHTRFQYDGIYNNSVHFVRNFDGFDGSKVGQSGLIGVAAMTGQAGLKNHSEGLDMDIDFDDPEGVLPENFVEIFQTAIKNIINATDQLKTVQNQEENLKNSGDIFLDLPLSSQKARQGGYIPLEYQRYIFCSQCQEKNILETHSCSKCNGAGRVMAYRRVEIKIPKDSVDGAVLQINNEGHAPAGDLFVKVIFRDEI